MSKNLVLRCLWNQLGCKEMMSMMNTVNVFTQHTDYLSMVLCKNDYEVEPKHCEKCSFSVCYSEHWNLQRNSPEKAWWPGHSYVKVNCDHGVKVQRGYNTHHLPNSKSAPGSERADGSMSPCSGHQPLEHHRFTTTLKRTRNFETTTLNWINRGIGSKIYENVIFHCLLPLSSLHSLTSPPLHTKNSLEILKIKRQS